LYTPLPSNIRATCPTHLILLDFITLTILGEENRSWNYSLWSFLHSPVTPSLLGPYILLNTLFYNTLSLRQNNLQLFITTTATCFCLKCSGILRLHIQSISSDSCLHSVNMNELSNRNTLL
jgi:hypothetical protein